MNDAPLAGINVLVTRPGAQAGALCAAIESAGGAALRLPVMAIEPRDAADIREDLAALPAADIVIYVSRNAVEHGAAHLRDSRAPVAAIGRATMDALESLGIDVSIDPGEGFTSENLLAHEALSAVAGKQVLIVRGDDGRTLLADTLGARGAAVTCLAVYRRRAATPAAARLAQVLDLWRSGGIDCVSVMSVATLEFLISMLPAEGIECLRQTPLVAPGERVIQTAGKLVPGIPAIQASGPLPGDIVSALIDWRRSGTNQ